MLKNYSGHHTAAKCNARLQPGEHASRLSVHQAEAWRSIYRIIFFIFIKVSGNLSVDIDATISQSGFETLTGMDVVPLNYGTLTKIIWRRLAENAER